MTAYVRQRSEAVAVDADELRLQKKFVPTASG